MGIIISIEGVDGVGKATQAQLLESYIRNKYTNKKTMLISPPHYGEWGCSLVEGFLEGKLGTDRNRINPYAISGFYTLDRYIYYETHWRDFYEESSNNIIIADRYSESNILYQTAFMKDGTTMLNRAKNILFYEHNLIAMPGANKTILLYCSPDKQEEMLSKRNDNKHGTKDINEENKSLLKDVLNRSLTLARYFGWEAIDVTDLLVDDKEESIQLIHEKIVENVEYLIK